MKELTVQELKSRLESKEPLHFIDVREEWEYQEHNIGAENIPLSVLMSKLEDLEDLKNEEIIIHCKMGGRSMQACMILEQAGFKNVINLSGGIHAWMEVYGNQSSI
jgi:rhodanese-related sulfurtransferase